MIVIPLHSTDENDFQASRISLLPCNVPYSDRPRTIEKHVFNLDVVFTVGPDDNPESVKRCAQILSRNECRLLADEICGRSSTIRNIVKGEVNATVARMTMEEIFKEREIFKDEGRYISAYKAIHEN